MPYPTPANKLSLAELQRRASLPKPHFSDNKAYKAWWMARVTLGLPTYQPSQTSNAIWKRRAKAKKINIPVDKQPIDAVGV